MQATKYDTELEQGLDLSSSQQQRQILTVSTLTKNIKRILEESFPFIWISGEISNLRIPSSGHAYFTLKDDKSQVAAVIFKGQLRQMAFALEDGLTIVGLCRVTVYEPRGTYQVIFEYIEPKGAGALQLAFEQLKQKLAREGLFDSEHKKPIPALPSRIGVITSPTGAVIRDILHVIERRYPNVQIDIFPVRVQGATAAAEVVKAIEFACRQGDCDVIILARGGGSIEDLAPFNSGCVARALFDAAIPIVTAIGHETDYTIADFVADLRAPTPSAAAEMVVPVKADLYLRCIELKNRCLQYVERSLRLLGERHSQLAGRLIHPKKKIQNLQLVLDDLEQRLCRAMMARLKYNQDHFDGLASHLYKIKLDRYVLNFKSKVNLLDYKLKQAMQISSDTYRNQLKRQQVSLAALDPKAVLRRGYGIVRTIPMKKVVCDANDVSVQEHLEVLLAKGSLNVIVKKKYPI